MLSATLNPVNVPVGEPAKSASSSTTKSSSPFSFFKAGGKHSAKLHPTPPTPCCEKGQHPEKAATHIVVFYKVVNWAALRADHTSTVGYQRVPFTPKQNAYHRALRKDGLVLERIEEEVKNGCESCVGRTFDAVNRPPCVGVTLR
ncbi:Aste57867_8045 [Aphanomyces stellatus]|uniref:Aste57867_8045 protein n=1 Tax=Aphanomyces stellatus TaxID=120398 RepID=A0A485KJ84_9STRA|nr:hypothetical protein As57867_008015 [Aphanomyces stellatus]VFT84937.1 Aste57867_8045 [Aphanomyces stellatus]